MANKNINTGEKLIFNVFSHRTAVLMLILAIIIIFGISVFIISQRITWLESSFQTPEGKIENFQKIPKITVPEVLYNLAGLIKKIENGVIFLEASIPKIDENGKPVQTTEIRKVTVQSSAKISRLIFIAEGTDKKVPKENKISLTDLKVGDYIEVISNKDISKSTEFEAIQVRLLPKSF